MLKSLKSAAKGTIIYGFANVSIKLLGIILIPIYTNYKYLSRAEFGVLGVLDTTYQLAIIIFGLSLYQSFARWYYDPEHREAQKSMHFTVIVINAAICLVSFVFIYFYAPSLSRLLFDTTRYERLIWIMFAGSSLNILSSVPMALLRLQEKALKYSVISIAKLMTTLGFTILFVVYYHRSVLGVYEAVLIGEATGLAIVFSEIIKNSIARFEMERFMQMLKYGIPLLMATLSSVLLNSFDRYSLNYLTDLNTVGTYTLAFRIANTIKVVVITSIQLSLVPILYKKLGDPDHKRFYAKSMNYSAFVVMFMVMCVSIYSLEIVKIFTSNKSYWEAARIIPILSVSMVFVMMKENILVGLQITKSTTTMGILIALTAAINLGLNILLIPLYGIFGSAFSTLISQVFMFVLFYFVAQRKYPIPYELKNLLVMVISGVGVILASLVTLPWAVIPRIFFKAVIIGAWPFLLILLGFYEPIELQRMREFIMKLKGFRFLQKLVRR